MSLLVLAGLGLSLSTATQARFAGPVGIGELLLLFVMLRLALLSAAESFRPGVECVQLMLSLLAVLVLGGASMAVGSWLAGLLGHAAAVEWRTAGLVIAALLLPVFMLTAGSDARCFGVVILVIGASYTGQFIVLGGFERFIGNVPGVEVWYEGDVARFTGLSSNPNQLALALVPLPFLLLRVAGVVAGSRRLSYLLTALIAACGVMTASDALGVGWVSGVVVTVVLSIAVGTATPHLGELGRVVVSAALLALAGLALVLAAADLSDVGRAVESRLNEGNQASTRVGLWVHGLAAAAMSPVFGLGPGAFSGESGPFESIEAHSTLIDWLTMSGAVGLSALLGLVAVIAVHCLRRRALLCFGALVALLAFSMFHNVLRQPLFWFYLSAVYVLASSSNGEMRPRGEALKEGDERNQES
jgi:hypothetical protein